MILVVPCVIDARGPRRVKSPPRAFYTCSLPVDVVIAKTGKIAAEEVQSMLLGPGLMVVLLVVAQARDDVRLEASALRRERTPLDRPLPPHDHAWPHQ